MPRSISCQHCASKLQIPDRFTGGKAKCPKCGQVLTIPAAHAGAASSPPGSAVPASEANAKSDVAAVAAAPPRDESKRSAIPLRAALAGGGVLVVVGVIAAVAFSVWGGNSSHGPAPGPPATMAGETPPEPRNNRQSTDDLHEAAPDETASWHVYDNEPFRFRASFPIEPRLYDPTADIADPDERQLAAAAMEGRLNLQAVSEGRTLILSAAPIQLGGMPARTYLDRMSGSLPAIHRGFQIDQQHDIELSGNPGKDIVLQGEGATKLLRVLVANGHVYSLLMEGDDRLTFSDADARRFFTGFTPRGAAAGVAPATSAHAAGSPPGDAPRSPPAAGGEVTGEAIRFQVAFPDSGATAIDTLELIANSRQRQNRREQWSSDELVYETWQQSVGERVYRVTAFCDTTGLEGFARANNQRARFEVFTEMLYGMHARNTWVRYAPVELHGMHIQDIRLTLLSGRFVLVRLAQAGKYSFYLSVEGTSDVSLEDDAVRSFIDSLVPPDDIPPLPPPGVTHRGAIVRSYHPLNGVQFEIDGELIAARQTPLTVWLDPRGIQYEQAPNLMRDVVYRIGNVMDVVLGPPNQSSPLPTIREVRVVRVSTGE